MRFLFLFCIWVCVLNKLSSSSSFIILVRVNPVQVGEGWFLIFCLRSEFLSVVVLVWNMCSVCFPSFLCDVLFLCVIPYLNIFKWNKCSALLEAFVWVGVLFCLPAASGLCCVSLHRLVRAPTFCSEMIPHLKRETSYSFHIQWL